MKYIILLRTAPDFNAPGGEKIGFINKKDLVRIDTVDTEAGDEAIAQCFERIGRKINQVLGYRQYDVTVCMSGNITVGFAWKLKDFLKARYPGITFEWLDIATGKKTG